MAHTISQFQVDSTKSRHLSRRRKERKQNFDYSGNEFKKKDNQVWDKQGNYTP
jgi:hypothetical protein